MNKPNKRLKSVVIVLVALLIIACVINGKSTLLKFSYPLKYKEQVYKYSKENNVDPYLIFAIIKAESGFDQNATSQKNARGLMQITKETGQWAAKKLDIEQFDEEDLYNPDVNVRIGCWYVGWLMKQFDSKLDLVVASYNGGNGNVRKWLANKEFSSSGDTLDKIPFGETDRFLKKVKNYYKVYSELYST